MSSSAASLTPGTGQTGKLLYINNIKVLLTVLVILHHTVIAYSTTDGWYYSQKTSYTGALIPMTLFVSINQSFFMGFFFLLSAFFTGPSYNKKGAARFMADRLLRLGLPVLFYSFILSPLLSYLVYYFAKDHHITLLQYLKGYDSWIDPGVTWFVAALLIFTCVYVAAKRLFTCSFSKTIPVPKAGNILLFALALGLVSFLVRIACPVDWVLKPLGFKPGHFTQYIALFITGLLAFRNRWLEQLPERTGKQLTLSAWLCLLLFPVFYLIQVKTHIPVAWFSGGFHWQSLLYAVWEQWIGLSIITALLVRGKRSWNTSSPLLARLSRSSFAVYIFHPLAIVAVTLAVKDWSADPAVKLLLAAPLVVSGSFLLGRLILLIPVVRKIL